MSASGISPASTEVFVAEALSLSRSPDALQVWEKFRLGGPECIDAGDAANCLSVQRFGQRISRTTAWRYTGRTIMLVDERTISQAEHAALFFKAANGTTIVGSPTTGANGDVTQFVVPGNIWIGFTGQAVKHADGRQLQRLGVIPDILSYSTIAGIRAGRDEVLEDAVALLEVRRK